MKWELSASARWRRYGRPDKQGEGGTVQGEGDRQSNGGAHARSGKGHEESKLEIVWESHGGGREMEGAGKNVRCGHEG